MKLSPEEIAKRTRITRIWREVMKLDDQTDLHAFDEQWRFFAALLEAAPNG